MSTSPGFPESGERIGGYQLVRRLGQGGMGLVYEAVDTTLGRRVALKVISPHLAGDPSFRTRFTHEAQAQASLDSPHVVQVFAHGEADGRLFIASQLIPGGDLGAMVRANGAPPPRIALSLITQIAEGLADAHETGLVHRDIKPGNVLLRIRGEDVSAYLTDFGIARRTRVDQGLTTHGTAVGTPTYMAPELHTGGEPGPQSDVYSLGCLLWAALIGRAPYSATTDYQLVSAHLAAPIPQLVVTGPWEQEVNRVLRTAMAKQPSERYPSAAALRGDLRTIQRQCPAPSQVWPVSGHEQYGGASVGPRTPSGGTPLTPAAPTHRGPAAVPGRAPASGPRRTGLVVAAVALAVLLVAGSVTGIVLAAGGDDPRPADPSSTPPAQTGGPTEPTATDEHGLTPDEQVAAGNISEALQADGGLGPEEAECTARELVRKTGTDGLMEQGLLDEDLEFAGDNEDVDPQVLSDIFSVTFTCVFEQS
ncbi:MAG TPA: protein kinase [Nocardioides sp.]|nr:protein kinase [Nocardioides sp.]